MSSDPLLTSLCGICRILQPKYKCPRCGTRTCSLPCVKKHKNWSACDGERDPTVFIPATKLRTDAGIDHDYNFLHKIERKVEQAEKIFTEERGILPQREQPPPNKKARIHKGQSRGRTSIGNGLRPWARLAIGRLRTLEISVMQQPYGMSRAKENTTSYNKKNRIINWQVEWLFMDPASSTNEDKQVRAIRLLDKTLDNKPLYIGYAECLERQRFSQLSGIERKKESTKRRKEQSLANNGVHEDDLGYTQHAKTSTWRDATEIEQNATSGCWDTTGSRREQTWNEWLAGREKNKYQFFFHIPGAPSREAQKLMPVEPTDALETILSGLEVLEFPTIYVLPASSSLPEGYVLEKRVQREPKKEEGKKRKSSALVEYGSSDDEGEIRQADGIWEGEESDQGFEFSDEAKAAKYLNSEDLEDGEIQDDEDMTSSSGFDSSDMDVVSE
ncbi:hypothetical protein BJ170DRAFT_589770 [Xylariales sp. AK1849]|nr:hypothetical protein BJ170DRAFT_589770 [Xylariales sp. AK1849]